MASNPSRTCPAVHYDEKWSRISHGLHLKTSWKLAGFEEMKRAENEMEGTEKPTGIAEACSG